MKHSMGTSNARPLRRTRPIGATLILIFYAAVTLQVVFAYSRGEVVLVNGQATTLRLSAAGKIVRGSVLCLKLFAAIQLFRLRRSATTLFTVAWFASLPIAGRDFVAGLDARHPVLIASASVLSFLFLTGIVLYSYRLSRAGLLPSTDSPGFSG